MNRLLSKQEIENLFCIHCNDYKVSCRGHCSDYNDALLISTAQDTKSIKWMVDRIEEWFMMSEVVLFKGNINAKTSYEWINLKKEVGL